MACMQGYLTARSISCMPRRVQRQAQARTPWLEPAKGARSAHRRGRGGPVLLCWRPRVGSSRLHSYCPALLSPSRRIWYGPRCLRGPHARCTCMHIMRVETRLTAAEVPACMLAALSSARDASCRSLARPRVIPHLSHRPARAASQEVQRRAPHVHEPRVTAAPRVQALAGHAAAREGRRGRAGRRACCCGCSRPCPVAALVAALFYAQVSQAGLLVLPVLAWLCVSTPAPHEHLAAQRLREPAAPHAQHCVAAGVWRRCRGVGGSHAAAPCMRRLVCGHRGLAALPRRRRLRRRRLACSRCMHAAARMRPLHAVGGAQAMHAAQHSCAAGIVC